MLKFIEVNILKIKKNWKFFIWIIKMKKNKKIKIKIKMKIKMKIKKKI